MPDSSSLQRTNLVKVGIAQRSIAKAPLPSAEAIDGRIRLAIEIATEDLAKPVSLNQVSFRVGLSPSRFGHLFKDIIGKGFKAFLLETRLSRAKLLLQDPTRRVKEVANEVGYSDMSNFSRHFSKRYAISPQEWRRRPIAIPTNE